ncbi:hypothetical protein Q6284_33000, partial [Klebsiella pneumoniae]|uniref:hypothetical protein n=1 Tax=Klebsiella pneumoniae TaxID=573 RepID=UPI0027316BB0
PQISTLTTLQTHISKTIPILNLTTILQNKQQPLLILHKITKNLTLLKPLNITFSQGCHDQKQQQQHQPPTTQNTHHSLNST